MPSCKGRRRVGLVFCVLFISHSDLKARTPKLRGKLLKYQICITLSILSTNISRVECKCTSACAYEPCNEWFTNVGFTSRGQQPLLMLNALPSLTEWNGRHFPSCFTLNCRQCVSGQLRKCFGLELTHLVAQSNFRHRGKTHLALGEDWLLKEEVGTNWA